jgi:hypothetical protein
LQNLGYLVLAYLNKQLRRDRRQDRKGFASISCYARDRCLLICIFLSTKGAYYGANKQAQIKGSKR